MDYHITHRTHYQYEETVSLCHNLLCLTPRTTPYQTMKDMRMNVQPSTLLLERFVDSFGNHVHYLEINKAHEEFSITTSSQVTVHDAPLPYLDDSPPWEEALWVLPVIAPTLEHCERLFRLDSPMVRRSPEIRHYAAVSFPPGRPLLQGVADLTRRIYTDFTFSPGATTVFSTVEEVFASRHGVCQDFAHFEIACLRAMGFAARYVSGYLETLPPPGQPKLVGVDASHAWIAVLTPDVGWVDFDPTNNLIPTHRYVTLAWGRDYSDVPPVKGVVYGGAKHILTVAVDMLT